MGTQFEEQEKLSELQSQGRLDSRPEERLDRLSRLASRLLATPIAFINLLDHDRQWTKSCVGIERADVAAADAICAQVMALRRPLVVPDLRLEKPFAGLSQVVGPPFLRFYAGHPLRGPKGDLAGVLAVADTDPRDLDEEGRRLLEELAALVETELALAAAAAARERLRTILNSLGDPVATIDAETRIVDVNPSAERLLGRIREELAGLRLDSLLPAPGDRPGLAATLASAGRHEVRREVSMALPDGHEVTVELTFAQLAGEGVERWVCIFRDVTDRRIASEAMAAQSVRLREQAALLDQARDAILVTSQPGGRITFWNRGATDIYGYTIREASGQVVDELLKTRWPGGRAQVEAALADKGTWEGEVVHIRKDGTPVHLESRQVRMLDDDRVVVGVLEVNRDISERRAAERDRLAVMENSPLGICTIGLNGVFRSANPALGGLLRLPPEQLVGMTFADVTHPDDVAPTRKLYADLAASQHSHASLETRYRRTDGGFFWGHLTAAPIRLESGEIDYFLAMVEDISDQRAALAELKRVSQDKSYFLSLVGHEFRTALTGILGFSELLKDTELEAADVHEFASDIHSDAERLSRLINEMLDLDRIESGRMTLNLEPLDLREVVDESVAHARNLSPIHSLAVERPNERLGIRGDRDKLAQVMANLISNAIKYSPEGGTVTITGEHFGSQVEVSVRDEGLGIPESARERIFERYARVDAADRKHISGTGLGLPIVKQIVELHGGTVKVESGEGAGSTFRVRLPV